MRALGRARVQEPTTPNADPCVVCTRTGQPTETRSDRGVEYTICVTHGPCIAAAKRAGTWKP